MSIARLPNFFFQIISQMFVEREMLTLHYLPHNLMIYKMLTPHVLHTFGKEFGKTSITHI